MPSGPGPIAQHLIAEIVAWVRGHTSRPVRSFLLTCLQDAEAIAAQFQRCAVPTTLQRVDPVPHDELRRLPDLLPGVELVQVIHVQGEPSIEEARAAAPWVDAILLDSGNPTLAVKTLGGTGRVHDWGLSRPIGEAIGQKPLWLAGGLTPGNAMDAVAAVAPFGLDVCSGVRSGGQLNRSKLMAFAQALA